MNAATYIIKIIGQGLNTVANPEDIVAIMFKIKKEFIKHEDLKNYDEERKNVILKNIIEDLERRINETATSKCSLAYNSYLEIRGMSEMVVFLSGVVRKRKKK